MAELTLFERFTDSTELIRDPEALRARAGTDGYLFLPHLIPEEDVLEVRQAVLEVLRTAGWSDEVGLAPAGVHPVVEGQGAFEPIYDRIQSLEIFHRLAVHPLILEVYRNLFAEDVLAHPRNICRIIFPANNAYATPPHQDFLHIRGCADTWTAWIPLGACPISLGGLAVMGGSHVERLLPTHAALGAGGQSVDTAPLSYRWVSGDMDAGDVLTFHSHTVHQSLPNLTRDRMRLSVDYRYQPVSQPVVRDSLEPHHGRLTWSQIYQGWPRTDLQYYWRHLPLHVVERQASH